MGEDKRFLVEQKIDLFQTVATISITWWVSVIVVHVSLVAWMWLNRKEIRKTALFWLSSFLGGFFILLSAAHGITVKIYFDNVNRDIISLLSDSGLDSGAFESEFRFAEMAILNGIIAIMIVFVAYLMIWIANYAAYKDQERK